MLSQLQCGSEAWSILLGQVKLTLDSLLTRAAKWV